MSRLVVLYLCSLVLRSVVIVAFFAVIAAALRNVAWRHAVWATALGCVLLMPVADALVPETLLSSSLPEAVSLPIQALFIVPAQQWLPPPQALTPDAAPVKPSIGVWEAIALSVALVVVGLLIRQLWALLQVARLKKRSRPIDEPSLQSLAIDGVAPACLLESNEIVTPLTVGFLRPALILPGDWRGWDSWKLRAVVVHELMHVRRSDWAIAVVAAFARCVFWFNPLVWWIERRLSLLAEQACDEASICKLGDAPRYAETLLEFASNMRRGHRWIGGVAMAQHKISRRIDRVLALRSPGSGLLPRAAWLTLAALAFPVMYFSAASPAAVQTELPSLSPAEIVNAVRSRLPETPAIAMVQAPPQPATPAPSVEPPVVEASAEEAIPAGEWDMESLRIRLLSGGFSPEVVEEIRNTATASVSFYQGQGTFRYYQGWDGRGLPPAFFDKNAAYLFALTRVQGRTAFFEDTNGGVFSFGCSACSFQAGESGVGALRATEPGIIFKLGADGTSMTATCRAVECRIGVNSQLTSNPSTGRFPGTSFAILTDGQSLSFGVHQATANPPALTCFSIFGAVKADGTPFTAADCPNGTSPLPETVLFSVNRK